MNIKQVARLLNEIGIPTIVTDTSIRPDVSYGINYYKLMFDKDSNKWELLYVPRERRSSGGEKVRRMFFDEANASKYYYLIELNSYFWQNYIYPFIRNNQDIMDNTNFTLENLKEAFRKLNISKKYYSFNGEVKEHSIVLERINKEESKLHNIGKNGKIVTTSLVVKNSSAYFSMYQRVYYLYLFDQHYKELIKNKEIGHIFTDDDYETLLTGVVIESTD